MENISSYPSQVTTVPILASFSPFSPGKNKCKKQNLIVAFGVCVRRVVGGGGGGYKTTRVLVRNLSCVCCLSH